MAPARPILPDREARWLMRMGRLHGADWAKLCAKTDDKGRAFLYRVG
ncbi:hypothetical protein [Roseovarius aestuariivivens]|nr:hypothetical protein [Roseovarius aestuariivivens]